MERDNPAAPKLELALLDGKNKNLIAADVGFRISNPALQQRISENWQTAHDFAYAISQKKPSDFTNDNLREIVERRHAIGWFFENDYKLEPATEKLAGVLQIAAGKGIGVEGRTK